MRLSNNILIFVLLQGINNCFSYIITVDSHAEECFFDSGGLIDDVFKELSAVDLVEIIRSLLFINSKLWQ